MLKIWRLRQRVTVCVATGTICLAHHKQQTPLHKVYIAKALEIRYGGVFLCEKWIFL